MSGGAASGAPAEQGARRGWRWPFARHGTGRTEIVPRARLAGPIPWVIAIMVALMVVAGAGALALRKAGQSAAHELSGGITVQIVEARSEERARQVDAAAALLQHTAGITAARIVPQEQLDALVEPWLGAADGAADQIAMPALIDARMAGPVSAERLAALRRNLQVVAPAARVDAQSGWLKPVFAAIEALQWLAAALIVMLGAAAGAAVLLAARSALGTNRATIEIVHLLGGTDAQIARIFQRSISLGAAGGALAGFAIAVAAIVVLRSSLDALQGGIAAGATLGPAEWATLLLVPLAIVLVATLTARWTVLRALRRML